MKFLKAFIITVLLMTTLPVLAVEEQLLALLKQKQDDTMTREAAIVAGSDRALLCKYCHGNDGNSKKNTIPNLAEQNPAYLIKQFELFATGARNNKTMNEMAKILTDDDKVNIALFYASQKATPTTPFKPELVATGKQVYDAKCFMCHGKDGHGTGEFPRVASQPSEYIIRTLSSYQSPLVKRAQSAMSAIAAGLQKAEIEAIASYLSVLE